MWCLLLIPRSKSADEHDAKHIILINFFLYLLRAVSVLDSKHCGSTRLQPVGLWEVREVVPAVQKQLLCDQQRSKHPLRRRSFTSRRLCYRTRCLFSQLAQWADSVFPKRTLSGIDRYFHPYWFLFDNTMYFHFNYLHGCLLQRRTSISEKVPNPQPLDGSCCYRAVSGDDTD